MALHRAVVQGPHIAAANPYDDQGSERGAGQAPAQKSRLLREKASGGGHATVRSSAAETLADDRTASAHVWAEYDLIHSDWPTADKALEQALGFLEMRCD